LRLRAVPTSRRLTGDCREPSFARNGVGTHRMGRGCEIAVESDLRSGFTGTPIGRAERVLAERGRACVCVLCRHRDA
jgi:hypothetical protein